MNVFSNNRGFTLFEVIVVIVLAGIIAAIAIPSFFMWLPNIRFRQASSDFFVDLQMAKIEAVKRNVNVGVEFTLAAGGCPALGDPVPVNNRGSYIVFVDDGAGGGTVNDGLLNGTELEVIDRNFPRNVAFCTNSAAANIVFQPDGLPMVLGAPPAAPIILTFQNDTGRQGQINVSLAGNIAHN